MKKLLIVILLLCMIFLMAGCKDRVNGIETTMGRFVIVQGFHYNFDQAGYSVYEDTVTSALYLYDGNYNSLCPFLDKDGTMMTKEKLFEQERKRIGTK